MPPFKYLPDYHAPDAMTDDEASDHSTQADELPAMTQTPMSAQKFTIGSHSAVQIIKYFRLNTISDENALKVECSYWVRRKFIKHGRQPFYDVAQLDTLTDELVKHLTSTFRGQPAFGAVFKELQDRPRGAKDAIQGLMRVLATELPKTRPQQPRPASEGVAKEGKLQGKSNEETQGSKGITFPCPRYVHELTYGQSLFRTHRLELRDHCQQSTLITTCEIRSVWRTMTSRTVVPPYGPDRKTHLAVHPTHPPELRPRLLQARLLLYPPHCPIMSSATCPLNSLALSITSSP